MPVDIIKLLTYVMADLPDIKDLIDAIVKAVAAEKAAKSFSERQAVSEPVQRALAALADKIKAQVESFEASQKVQ